jgi:hypothetical protein
LAPLIVAKLAIISSNDLSMTIARTMANKLSNEIQGEKGKLVFNQLNLFFDVYKNYGTNFYRSVKLDYISTTDYDSFYKLFYQIVKLIFLKNLFSANRFRSHFSSILG